MNPIRRILRDEPSTSLFHISNFDAIFNGCVEVRTDYRDFDWLEQVCSECGLRSEHHNAIDVNFRIMIGD